MTTNEPAIGYIIVSTKSVCLNRVVLNHNPPSSPDERCCLVMPSGKAAEDEYGSRPHYYQNTAEAIADSYVLVKAI